MNTMQHWMGIMRLAVSSVRVFIVTGFAILFLYGISLASMIATNEKLSQFIVGDIVFSFVLYLTMIVTAIAAYSSRHKVTKFSKHILRALRSNWWVMLIKLIWNALNAFVMGIEYLPDPTAGLFSSFVLLFVWIFLFFVAAYIMPRSVIDNKANDSFSLASFVEYMKHAFWYLFFFSLCSAATTAFALFVISFFVSYVPYFIGSIVSPEMLKIGIELFLAVCAQVLCAQLFAISALYIYINKVPRNMKSAKIYSLE